MFGRGWEPEGIPRELGVADVRMLDFPNLS